VRAAVSLRYGSPDVVQIRDVPVPRPGKDDVLIAVYSSTVNRTDCHYRSGRPLFMHAVAGWLRPKSTILGTEYAGVVEELGPDAQGFKRGDRVFGWIEGRFGAHAEYLAARSTGAIARVPNDQRLSEAAPMTEGAHYALNSLRKLKIGSGTSLLVYGATGSIGSAAVQLAKAIGTGVTAVGPTAHVGVMRALGADHVVGYETEDVSAQPQRYDAILDAWGHADYFSLRRLLRPSGSYVSTGAGAHKENLVLPFVSPLMRHRRARFAYPHIDQAMVESFASQLEAGSYRPLIDRLFPLEEIVAAYRYVETGQKLGNVVITIREDDQGTTERSP
jgi:NADPH:quinone reductase-like Zn-dependent oxidoreductase